MHVNNNEGSSVFQPVTIEIVLETPEELRGFGTICNYTPFTDSASAVGIELSDLFDSLPEGKYDHSTWDEDVAPLATALANHPALHTPNVNAGAVPEEIIGDMIEIVIDDFLAPTAEEVAPSAPPAVPVSKSGITCELIDVVNYQGTIKVSDGRSYKYQIANCGVAIKISTMGGTPITEVPMSVKGGQKLLPADIEVLEAVFSQIS